MVSLYKQSVSHFTRKWYPDSFGHVRSAGSLKLSGFYSPVVAEAVAILHGVRLAFDSGLSLLLVESDALGVINVLKGSVVPSSDLGLIISDIFFVCNRFNVLGFPFIPRKGNMVANALAKGAISSDANVVWTHCCLPLVEVLVQTDFPD
ncbi:hypothetical protein ACOSQ2_014604 [Xanthoceras sorbifolium]